MVRQLFESGVIQSGFWHQFAMTAHSPVGLHPADFGVVHTGPAFGGFAENDFYHTDPTGADHDLFSEGLKNSLFNYMQGVGFDIQLQAWFDFPVPVTTVSAAYISDCLALESNPVLRPTDKVCWIGGDPVEMVLVGVRGPKKKKESEAFAELVFSDKTGSYTILMKERQASWFVGFLEELDEKEAGKMTFYQLKESYVTQINDDFVHFESSGAWEMLRIKGLLFV
jgi:hypothetical protein